MIHAHYEETSSRYRAMTFTHSPEENAHIDADIDARFATLFGDTPYTPEIGTWDRFQQGNGEVNREGPDASPAWRERIEKARREIEEHESEFRVREMAEAITDEAFILWCSILEKGQA